MSRTGILQIDDLLASMKPVLSSEEYVFCTVEGGLSDHLNLKPIATFDEREGLTLVITRQTANSAGIDYENTYRQITLTVHSSLEAVGLTAAVSRQLASVGVSANVIAAFYHDHIFVQSDKADIALSALQALSEESR